MLLSMTGFGEGSATTGVITVVVTAKSVNNRFLEIGVRLPDLLASFERGVVSVVQDRLSRGKVFLNISLNSTTKTDIFDIALDKPLLEKYMSEISTIEAVSGDLTIVDIVSLPDVLALRPREDFIERVSGLIEKSVVEALSGLIEMRTREGKAIETDILKRLDAIEDKVDGLSKSTEMSRESYIERLRDKIASLLEGRASIDEERLLQEAAYLAQKTDPTEELTRLRSHLNQFREAIGSEEPVGSKLRFILQECNREVDTTGAKGDTSKTSELVIAMKEQLERIREQIQNVE